MTDETRKYDILDYGKFLWRRKAMLAVLFMVFVVSTMVVSLLLPKYYRSEAVILATAPEAGGLGAALSSTPLVGALAGPLGALNSPADKILVLLKSRTVADMVIKRFTLLRVFNASDWDAEKGVWKDPTDPPLMEDAVKRLRKNVTAFKKTREGTITITVEWKDPMLAAQIANYYVVALAEFMKDKAVNTTVQIVDPAVPAERKSFPRVGLNMIIAGILSIVIGIPVALILESPQPRNKA